MLALAGVAASPARAANPAEIFELPKVVVIGTTPLPGLGTAIADVPANVQVFGNRELSRQSTLDVSGFLDRNANSVGVGSAQGNSYQQDLSFRGFAASPLLGTPQGISVFQDGMRINEAFGDVVNWDLLPRSAISTVQLIPGSNPVFGLNTLGGALAVYTKSGAQYPGASLEVSTGSFRRRSATFAYGGADDRLDYFATGNVADDGGWAEHNGSRLRQFFGKLGYQDERADLDVSLTLADNTLQGAQTLPVSFLDTPRQAYTFPDINRNRLTLLAAKGSRFLERFEPAGRQRLRSPLPQRQHQQQRQRRLRRDRSRHRRSARQRGDQRSLADGSERLGRRIAADDAAPHRPATAISWSSAPASTPATHASGSRRSRRRLPPIARRSRPGDYTARNRCRDDQSVPGRLHRRHAFAGGRLDAVARRALQLRARPHRRPQRHRSARSMESTSSRASCRRSASTSSPRAR